MTYEAGTYDIIVIGAGHAGCEAALACARMGLSTLCTTISMDAVAFMACNPSIGGPAKAHLVREIDALGGEMGINTDETLLQIRTLNTGKGAAVQALRAQADKRAYHQRMKRVMENTANLDLRQAEVVDILTENGSACGIVTALGAIYRAGAIVLATGVYLDSRVIIGDYTSSTGPSGLSPARHLSGALRNLGLTLRRFKTGTPCRVDGRTVDYTKMECQDGDEVMTPFSYMIESIERAQTPCWLTYTNTATHDIIRANLHRSPLYSGIIEGVGPRYCPSIEDKVVRFADKDRHQIFIEPESSGTQELYVQGMSTSLPEDVQAAMLRTIAGLENVRIMRTAYAIEYDCLDPLQLNSTLGVKSIEGLYTAGQINGSSGYEEAAAQGLLAGINAALYVKSEPPLILTRADAYLGVLVDDLVTKGTNEPYRMMTSRAEYRLLLRQDNADLRLTEMGRRVGLVTDERYSKYQYKLAQIAQANYALGKSISAEKVNPLLISQNLSPITGSAKLADLLKRPEIGYADLSGVAELPQLDKSTTLTVETEIKYSGYIERQQAEVQELRRLESRKMPDDIDYKLITGLRTEAKQKLSAIRPLTIGQAGRISGVSPADITVLMIYLERNSVNG